MPDNKRPTVNQATARSLILSGAAPEGMVVEGHLSFDGADKLPRSPFPADMQVLGALVLTDQHAIERLPEGLSAQELYLSNCPALAVLPASVRIGGRTAFMDCHSLSSIDAAIAGNELHVSHCLGLKGITPRRRPMSLRVARCPNISGEGLPVGTPLRKCRLHALAGLETVDQDLAVSEKLTFVACGKLGLLPKLHMVPQLLEVRECERFRGFQAGFEAHDLDVRNCLALETLPVGLRIWGNLSVKTCPALRGLSEGAGVYGNLRIDGSPEFQRAASALLGRGVMFVDGVEVWAPSTAPEAEDEPDAALTP